MAHVHPLSTTTNFQAGTHVPVTSRPSSFTKGHMPKPSWKPLALCRLPTPGRVKSDLKKLQALQRQKAAAPFDMTTDLGILREMCRSNLRRREQVLRKYKGWERQFTALLEPASASATSSSPAFRADAAGEHQPPSWVPDPMDLDPPADSHFSSSARPILRPKRPTFLHRTPISFYSAHPTLVSSKRRRPEDGEEENALGKAKRLCQRADGAVSLVFPGADAAVCAPEDDLVVRFERMRI